MKQIETKKTKQIEHKGKKINQIEHKSKITKQLEHEKGKIEQLEYRHKIRKAVVLAGGLGTRFLPGTLVLAKELFAIKGEPILMYHLRELADAGITDILIVGNKLKEESFNSFINPPKEYLEKIEKDGKLSLLQSYNDLKARFHSISYVNQEIGSDEFEKANKTGGQARGSSIAILAARKWAKGEPFMVVNGDDLCKYLDGKSPASELVDVFEKTGDYVIYGKEIPRELAYKYSSMVIGEAIPGGKGFKMNDIVEKPAPGTEPSNIMGFARYIFTSDVFDEIIHSAPRPNGEFCITDVISTVAKKGRVSTCIFDGAYYDCGSYMGFQMAGNFLLAEKPEEREKLKDELKTMFKLFE